MAQSNQDIAYNNSLNNVENLLTTVVTNTNEDWTSISTQMCDIQTNGNAVPIIKIEHFKNSVSQSVQYKTLLGSNYTITGTLGSCTAAGGAPDYSTLLGNIGTNTSNTNSSVGNVVTTLGSTNTSLSNIDTGINAINSKLNQTCAGNPIKVSVCNPTTVDFTGTNTILTNILGAKNSGNTTLNSIDGKISATNGKLDTVNTSLSSLNAKLNESCGGTPINVTVCNQPNSFVDFTATNALLTDIKNLDTGIKNDTATTIANLGNINTQLSTSNTHLNTIATKLGQNCSGSPLKVEVCNPATVTVDFSSTNSILSSIDTKTTSVVTNTGDTSTKLTSTNSKLDSVNTNLTTIYNKLNASCGSAPINVNVCNPASSSVDFGPTNVILSNILTQDTNTAGSTSSIDSKLTTTNNSLSTIAGVLTQTCAGTPLKVSVCNQIDLTTTQNTLAAIDGKLATVITNTATTATNTTSIAASNTNIATNTAATKTSVDAVNSNISTLKTQLTQPNTNHVVVDNFPAAAPTYNTNRLFTLTATGSLVLPANTHHSISISVVKGNATISYDGVSVVVPEGYVNNMEATTTLTNQVTISVTGTGNLVVVTTIQ